MRFVEEEVRDTGIPSRTNPDNVLLSWKVQFIPLFLFFVLTRPEEPSPFSKSFISLSTNTCRVSGLTPSTAMAFERLRLDGLPKRV